MAQNGVIPFGKAPWEQSNAPTNAPMPSAGVIPFGKAPWEQVQPAPQPPAPGVMQTALEHGANGLTLGYLPQIQAAAEPIATKIGNWLTGEHVQPDSYVNARDANVSRLAAESKANPKAAVGGEIGGALAGVALTPEMKIAEAGGVLGGLAKGAVMGAGYGAVSNPGDVPGKVDALQLGERASNAGHGALVGGVTGGVTQGAAKIISKIGNAPEALQEAANAQAVKSSGAMLKDFRALNGANRTQALGEFALNKGIVKNGDTITDVANKALGVQKDAGQRLDALYSNAKAAIKKLSFGDSQKAAEVGFNPVQNKSEILSKVGSELGDLPGKRSAMKMISNYIDQLGVDHGDQVLDPKSANNIESAVSSKINFYRAAGAGNTTAQEKQVALKALRSYLSDKVDQHIAFLGKVSGDPKAAAQLAEANRDYGFAKNLATMAKDKASRFMANRHLSLTDTIAGGAGLGAGALVGGEIGREGGGGMAGGASGALIGAVGAAALNHYGRTYGDAALASALDHAATVANLGPGQVGKALSHVVNPATANAATRVAAANSTLGGQLPGDGSENVQPPRAPHIQMGNAPGEQNASNIQKGPAKWAADGAKKIEAHAKSSGQSIDSDKLQGAMNNKKMHGLLIAASSLKPGSKAMDQIMAKVKNQLAGSRGD